MRTFDIPDIYKSSIIGKLKKRRQILDPRKKDFSPSMLDFGSLKFIIPRHFGFCFGVENAIEIAYKTLEENPEKNIYFLSQMIHNPSVNEDLESRGIKFIQDTHGEQLIPWENISKEDIVLIPAFGTTLETEGILNQIGIDTKKFNTTCPFVERVWKKSDKLSEEQHTVIIHGKAFHEETKATFSHASDKTKSIIVRNMAEAKILGQIILNESVSKDFFDKFDGKYSIDFEPLKDLIKVGVVNQTTMLANETQEIANYFKEIMIDKYGENNLKEHFADTRDTLCYATNDNQESIYQVLKEEADIAIIVGGYNSSNTTHLGKILESKFNTYFIDSEDCILDKETIRHFDLNLGKEITSKIDLFDNQKIIVASGASCPDTILDATMIKLLKFFPNTKNIEDVVSSLEKLD